MIDDESYYSPPVVAAAAAVPPVAVPPVGVPPVGPPGGPPGGPPPSYIDITISTDNTKLKKWIAAAGLAFMEGGGSVKKNKNILIAKYYPSRPRVF